MNTHYLDLLNELQISNKDATTLVETGTHRGAGAEAWGSIFEKVHTIELSDSLYKYCLNTYDLSNVNFIHGASTDVLEELVDNIKEPYVLFLDAHGSGGDTTYDEATGRFGSPVLEELEAVKSNPPTCIIIDDLRCFDDPSLNYPNRDQIINKIQDVGDYGEPIVCNLNLPGNPSHNQPQWYCFKLR